MLLPHDLARLEERRIALVIAELANEHIAVGSGTAGYGGSADSWLNLVAGVAMDGPVSDEALDRMVVFYEEHRVRPKVEVCPFADESLARGLGERGFRLTKFETVLCRDLEDAERAPLPDGARFERFTVDDRASVERFLEAHGECFADGEMHRRSLEDAARRMLGHHRTTAWLVCVGDELAGGGALETFGELATLIAAGIREPFRRRGLQSAFISHRCAVAREAGCRVATIGSLPNSPTGRNALRAGFVTAYTKAILQRPPRP